MADISALPEGEFEEFVRKLEAGEGGNKPSETRMAVILSDAMRTDDPQQKAQLYVELANMALTMADTTLGVQGSVATSVQLRIH
ncbi:hypothetical protein [Noviherbaspirillum malthae]|uniref:hypothetical protein n=1 Tax=Noviherbaspirillum malthae TaxID=1260987 RepID=UPI00188EE577|nr:hypothetical protein [Noviherbaspirillum malthae]